jgi:hypothetical protein
MNADALLLGIGFSVPLTFGLLSAAFDVAAHRSRRRNSIPLARSKPEDRAEALLNEWLCPEQRATLERHGYFEVRGCHTGKRYRIRRGRNMNIEELGKKWCPSCRLVLRSCGASSRWGRDANPEARLRDQRASRTRSG